MRLFRRRIDRDQEGAALLEGAVVFPFLFALSFGVFEFSNIFFQHHVITTGVRDAARYAARAVSADPAQPITGQQESAIINLATRATLDTSGNPRLAWWLDGAPNVSFDVTLSEVENDIDPITGERLYRTPGNRPVRMVEVSTTVTYPVMGFFAVLGIDGVTMQIAHQERVIGG